MTTAVAFEQVNFKYQDSLILRDVSFAVEEGSFIGIIGPNGGGKTTLLKLILGFLEASSGHISVLPHTANKTFGQVAYVPQSLRYDRQFPISVYELVLTGRLSRLPWYGIYSKKDHIATEEAIAHMGLSHTKNLPFGHLSGGQAQRALIARALVSEPKLLLLDEPTASVDSQAEADIYAILKDLKGKMTIMMVTHQLKVAINYVERILCVQNTLHSLLPQEVCEHFALGLYHTPLLKIATEGPHDLVS